MPAREPQSRSLAASIAAHERWSRESNPSVATALARTAVAQRFETLVDPDRVLPPAQRARMAEHARKAHMTRLALRSAQSRRKAAAARREAQQLDAAAGAADAELRAAEALAEHVRQVVDAAPALTPEQIEQLRGLLPAPRDDRGPSAA